MTNLSAHNDKSGEQLRKTQRVERLAELGTLAGHLAHEIRNPLSTIKINLQLLAEDITSCVQDNGKAHSDLACSQPADDRLKSYQRQLRKIETITKETDRLTATLNDFLNYAGRMELHPVRCDIHELLDELIDFYEPQALSRDVQLRYSFAPEPVFCRVDPDLIKQAILNLFINAAQAMRNGGDLIVRTSLQGDVVRIDIIDTGPGIPPQDQQKVFDPYYTTRAGGTGLGLPTCRRIIEEHHGTIQLLGEPGKGSNFIILLPVISNE